MWVLLLAGGAWQAQRWLDQRAEARQARVLIDKAGDPKLELSSDRYGQYLVQGAINNQEVLFLVDTGASGISIPEAVENRLGLSRGRPFEVITANGTITVYHTELDSIRIGPFHRGEARAHINPSMDGEVALLGMSFLRHFELLQRAGKLTISLPLADTE